jgi:hypothetical protein
MPTAIGSMKSGTWTNRRPTPITVARPTQIIQGCLAVIGITGGGGAGTAGAVFGLAAAARGVVGAGSAADGRAGAAGRVGGGVV